ncbi:hypothetical protein GE21DRAFT_1310856 [Neurospora crassa]|nr:hypothetical protein GE21DRAFT_1310856 [Neurospora crassa]
MDRSRAENPTKTATRFRFVARPDILGPYDAYIKLVTLALPSPSWRRVVWGERAGRKKRSSGGGAGEWREEGGQLSCGFSFDKQTIHS